MKRTSFLQIFPRYFFLLLAVFFAAGFFTFYDSFRAYRAEAELVVVSRGPASPSGIAETLSRIPETLAFYDRLRKEHVNISDPWAEESPVNRKRAWDSVIASSSVSGSGSIRLSVVGPDPSQASALLNASIETLYGFSGRLYNRDTEAEVRLLEHVIAYPFVTNIWALTSLSVACAIVAALLFSLLFRTLSDIPKYSGPFGSIFSQQRFFLKGKKGEIRPVGSFPDIEPEEVSPLIESSTPIASGQQLSELDTSEQENEDKVSGFPQSQETRPTESFRELGTVRQSESEEKDLSSPQETRKSAIEEGSSVSRERDNNDPEDIWEKSRSHFSVENSAVKAKKSIVGSNLSQESSAPEKKEGYLEQVPVESVPPAEDGRHVASSGMPGNLVTVSARDFTWEKFLFQNNNEEETIGKNERGNENKNTEPPEKAEVEKREPTPEELKERLNQLLRGEL
ncbi:MAG: hypothetical protein IPK84_05255 [Candidatus Moraniibacteriota bacterium]|nr:MAG: hypothetical protein IPK84_05255 [Candidatus Moranbacteria bacterium]